MNPMRTVNRAARVFLLTIAVSLGSYAEAGSSLTTDYSDLFWVHTESGWGIQVVQQETTIFATLFVYGPDGQPTWYTATLFYQGRRDDALAWTGTLYRTTGPWFGAATFDPAAVTIAPVGSMSLTAQFINTATLMYTVNGVQVTKTIERQLLVYERYSGTYLGVMSQQGAGSSCNPAANTAGTSVNVQIAQDTGAEILETRFVVTSGRDTCTFTGNYGQSGHFGRVAGNYSCAGGDSGTFVFFEMARSFFDFRARTSLVSGSGCTLKGYLGGLRQPPPGQ